MRAEWIARRKNDTLAQQNVRLREAVLRYAVACAQVDLQKAMLQARNEGRDLLLEGLKHSLDEEERASHELRELAKAIQAESHAEEDSRSEETSGRQGEQ